MIPRTAEYPLRRKVAWVISGAVTFLSGLLIVLSFRWPANDIDPLAGISGGFAAGAYGFVLLSLTDSPCRWAHAGSVLALGFLHMAWILPATAITTAASCGLVSEAGAMCFSTGIIFAAVCSLVTRSAVVAFIQLTLTGWATAAAETGMTSLAAPIGLLHIGIATRLAWHVHAKRSAVQGGLCPACGYDLRGLPSNGCPECGHGKVIPPGSDQPRTPPTPALPRPQS